MVFIVQEAEGKDPVRAKLLPVIIVLKVTPVVLPKSAVTVSVQLVSVPDQIDMI